MKKTVLFFWLLMALLKAWVAIHLDLYNDEAFYWQCAQRPGLAYADLPPLSAALVGAGTALFGDTVWGVRCLFWLIGAAMPLAVFVLARPLTGERRAWMAAGLSLALPSMGFQGALAIPDTPVLLWTILFLIGFERATRVGRTRDWLLAGAALALGMATHYRFALAPAAAGLYLLLTATGRRQWARPGLWLMAGVGLIGALPALIYNLRRGGEPLRYFLPGRHGSGFQIQEIAEHVAEQAVGASPLLYIGLWAALIALARRTRGGDDRPALFLAFAAVPVAVYLLASPFKSSGMQTMHWPIPGYAPLLVFLPEALARWRRGWATAAPTLGLAMALTVLVELGFGVFGLEEARRPYLGWREAAARAETLLDQFPGDGEEPPVVVADNYKLGAALEFRLGGKARVLILDHSKNYEHGRQLQFDRWNIGEDALGRLGGRRVLLAVQWSETVQRAKANWIVHLDWLFTSRTAIDELIVPLKRKPIRVEFFDAVVQAR